MPGPWTRRQVIQSIALSPSLLAKISASLTSTAIIGGCSPTEAARPLSGSILGANKNRGHRVRNLDVPKLDEGDWKDVDVVIVGGGIAGLSSGWELKRSGVTDFVLLELEDDIGGTSRGGLGPVTNYPWGAHYLPAPMASNKKLLELLEEMEVVSGYDENGKPVFAEENLCRDPAERLFSNGRWNEELVPSEFEDADRLEWDRFREEIDRWVAWRDDQGRRAFTLPIANCSDTQEVKRLDQISMSDWMKENRFQSEIVRWEIDYACRDDYGTTPEQTSAWAGIFYFAARMEVPGTSSQPFLTWPEGNARIANHLAGKLGSNAQTGMTVLSILPNENAPGICEIVVLDSKTNTTLGYRAKKAIFAAPQFIARFIIQGYQAARSEAISSFTYAPWLVANLHLDKRPDENGFPAAWDNVIYDSRGLGYVIATHQTGQDHGPTVLTYYLPLCDSDPKEARIWLDKLSWEASAELVLADLEKAHPDIRRIVGRLDVMHWGHAMIRPVPGFMHGDARLVCQKPFHNIHFANTDLSGMALMEEAFFHGVRAAQEVLTGMREVV